MFNFKLTEPETQLMKRVCELQLDSLEKILDGKNETHVEKKRIEHSVSEKELKEMITEVAQQYREILLQPRDLFKTHTDLLSNFRDALDFNSNHLSDFNGLISPMLNKLDLAIYIVRNRN